MSVSFVQKCQRKQYVRLVLFCNNHRMNRVNSDSQCSKHDDSAINIVLVITIIIFITVRNLLECSLYLN